MSGIAVVVYLAAVVAANLSVAAFGPSVTVINAFWLIGLDLTVRDRLHDRWEGPWLPVRMAALIAAGGLLSWLLNRDAGPIAVASTVAFVVSGALDATAYALLGRYRRLVRVNGSNVAGAAADSLIFPALAFGGFLPVIVLGQFAAKVAGGFLWSLLLTTPRKLRRHVRDIDARRWQPAKHASDLPLYVAGCPECEYATVHRHG